MYWSYGRGKQIANAIGWLGGKPLPVEFCSHPYGYGSHPYGYCRCNEDADSVAVAYFNCSPDGIDKLKLTFNKPIKSINVIGGKGMQIDEKTAVLEDICSFGYAAITADYK
jgi:hypothetical protein